MAENKKSNKYKQTSGAAQSGVRRQSAVNQSTNVNSNKNNNNSNKNSNNNKNINKNSNNGNGAFKNESPKKQKQTFLAQSKSGVNSGSKKSGSKTKGGSKSQKKY